MRDPDRGWRRGPTRLEGGDQDSVDSYTLLFRAGPDLQTTMPSSVNRVKRRRRNLHAIIFALMSVAKRLAVLAALTLVSAATACSKPPRLAADLVITGARIWTGTAAATATAGAVIAHRIVDVGSAEDIERWRGPNTTVLNAEGRLVLPGFNDARVRFTDGGRQLDEVDLRGAATAAEFARRINERAKIKPGEWVLGGGWDERAWTPADLPGRALIDDITNSSPVFVRRYDGGMALANPAALGRAGITERTPDPAGGVIVRGANGFPTGVLQGTAMDAVVRVIPAVTPEQRVHAIKRALEHAESLGITSVQDLGATGDDIAAYGERAPRGELTVRVYAVTAEAGWYDQAKLGLRHAFGSPWLRIGAVHADLDTGGGAEAMRARVVGADHAGLQLSIAPADDAVVPVLDLFDAIAAANGGRNRRFRAD